MSQYKMYQAIAGLVEARLHCIKTGNEEWIDRHEKSLKDLEDELPSGSGFDSGTQIDLDRSTANKLVFHTAYHHMDDGYYSGWSEHSVIVTPALHAGFNLKVTGRDRNDIKSYIGEMFGQILEKMVTW